MTTDIEGIQWIHLKDDGADIYFIANTKDGDLAPTLTIEGIGRTPEVWDPETGETSVAKIWKMIDGKTQVKVCKIKGKASNVCKYKDALTPILEEIAQADGLAMGSPIYFGDVTGQMRTFLERLAFPWLSYNDYSLTAPKKMPVVLMETMNGLPEMKDFVNRFLHQFDR